MVVVERDDALCWPRQVGDDEADARIKLARVPLDLRHNPPRLLPTLRLIAEAGIIAAHLIRRSPDRALEQVSDFVLQDAVGRQPDHVTYAFGFKELVNLGVGEGGVAAEIAPLHLLPV